MEEHWYDVLNLRHDCNLIEENIKDESNGLLRRYRYRYFFIITIW